MASKDLMVIGPDGTLTTNRALYRNLGDAPKERGRQVLSLDQGEVEMLRRVLAGFADHNSGWDLLTRDQAKALHLLHRLRRLDP